MNGYVKALAGNPEHPPLYHLLTRFWMQVFNDPVASRTISILLSLAALPCIYWLCAELFNSSLIAWITVLLAAVSPFNIMAAQNATQYSLWLLILSLSSALFLRALRQETKRDWAIYGISVALGFYTHLFFAIAVITHGLYLLLARGWRSIKVWFSYILATLLGMLLFSPWLITILTRLDKIEENTRYYRSFDDNNLQLMAKTLMANLGNAFLDFHNQNRLESYFDLAFILFVIYAIYFLIRNSSKKEWLFPILLAITTLLAHWTPDLISSSARSLQMRYYLPYFLAIQLIIAYLLAGYIQLMPFKRWQQRLGRLGLLGLVSAGVISGIFISQINDWGIDDQKGTASSRNLQVAPVLNQSSKPLVISDATHSFILALSHLVKDDVSFKLFKPEDSAAWESVVDLQSLSQKYSDIYLYNPDQKLIDFVDQQDAFDANQVPNTNNYLYQVVPQENEDDSKPNSSLLDEG